MKTELKKQNALEGNRLTFFQTGLIIALLLTLAAFEWNSPIRSYQLPEHFEPPIIEETPVTKPKPPEEKPKPKPKPLLTLIEITTKPTATDTFEIVDALIGYEPAHPVTLPDETRVTDPLLIVEIMPEFPGGDMARLKYLSENIRYPRQALDVGVQGRVYLSFIVETDGSISNVSVHRGIGSGCDEEAIRVISNMPRWSPGIQMGKKVRVLFSTDIKFTIAQ